MKASCKGILHSVLRGFGLYGQFNAEAYISKINTKGHRFRMDFDDKENVIEFVKGEKIAYVTFSQLRLKNKILKLAEEFPEDVRIISENDGGMLYGTIPVDWVSIRRPRIMTEEQKQIAREVMEKWSKK